MTEKWPLLIVILGIALLLGLWAWAGSSTASDADFISLLKTPISELNLGHLLGLIFFAWLLWK